MIKKTIYKIFPIEKIIIEYFSGEVRWSDIVEMKEKEIAEPEYNPTYNVITDIREAKLDLGNLSEITSYLELLSTNEKTMGNRMTAALTDNPKHVIFSELFSIMKKDIPISIKSVSTLNAAFDWVRLDADKRDGIIKFLNEMNADIIHLETRK